MPARLTNATLFAALLVAFATGAGAVANGTAHGRWVVIAHGLAAMAVILLVPWKGRIIRYGLRRARLTRALSLLLAVLAVATLCFGIGYSTGLVRSVGGYPGMWLHVACALALVPLAVWHVVARRAPVRRTDLSRRNLLRAGVLGASAAGLYLALSGVTLAVLPGRRRRFTGSYETGSGDPTAMPVTIWLDDPVPDVDPQEWSLTVVDARGRHTLAPADLARYDTGVRAVLDCTSGWYAEQDWTGVPVTALVGDTTGGRSLLVRSVTGYGIRFPLDDLPHLLLATHVGGAPLSAGHGYPLRLVAPGRRGFWWVKWVDRIEVRPEPWWWQSPFPLT